MCSASASNLIGIALTPLLVAFVAGHLSRPLTARIVEPHKGVLSLVDRGSILLVVYTAFSVARAGAIILPLMIFRRLRLLDCAAIAQRYAGRAPGPDVAADAVLSG
ncbi:hypothetical protein ASE59_17805 [Sphingomonas sp. Leaf10]|nr:hypothetical protein ASE59_17805 [Sphingomonas sp. Leaf10]